MSARCRVSRWWLCVAVVMLRNLTRMQDLLTAGDDVLLLDGGLATELERRGHDLSDDLWSARLLLDRPDEIVATHRSYFAAGARGGHDLELPGELRGLRAPRVQPRRGERP